MLCNEFDSVWLYVHVIIFHVPVPAVAATPISSVCLECGTIQKSGRMSCCGRGGSWFGNCGSAGNAFFGHTWSEGIRACKGRQFQSATHQPHAFQPKSNASSDAACRDVNSKVAILDPHVSVSTPVNISTTMPGAIAMTVALNTPITALAHKSLTDNPGTSTSKANLAASTTIIHTLENLFSSVKTSATQYMTLVRSPSGDMLMMTSSDATNSSNPTLECEDLSPPVTHISMLLIIACLY